MSADFVRRGVRAVTRGGRVDRTIGLSIFLTLECASAGKRLGITREG